MWDLFLRLGHQLRALPGAIVGVDILAAFALADALAIDRLAVAELLPEIEAVAIPAMNESMRQELE